MFLKSNITKIFIAIAAFFCFVLAYLYTQQTSRQDSTTIFDNRKVTIRTDFSDKSFKWSKNAGELITKYLEMIDIKAPFTALMFDEEKEAYVREPIDSFIFTITPDSQPHFPVLSGNSVLSNIGLTKPDDSKLNVNIFLSDDLLNSETSSSLEEHVSFRIIESLIYSLKTINFTISSSDKEVFDSLQLLERSGVEPFVKYEVGKSLVELPSIVKTTYASHCGNYTYEPGAYVTRHYCDNGDTCSTASGSSPACGGGACTSTRECTSGSSSPCVTVNYADGGHGCAPGNLGNCYNGNCPSGSVGGGGGSTPTPTPTPGGGGGGGGGSCSWCAGSNQCPSTWNYSPSHSACSGGLGCCTDPGGGGGGDGGGGGGGGGECGLGAMEPMTVQLGKTVAVRIDADNGRSSWRDSSVEVRDINTGAENVIWVTNSGGDMNNAIANPNYVQPDRVFKNICCSPGGNGGERTFTFYFRGVAIGQDTVGVKYKISEIGDQDRTKTCNRSYSFRVTPPPKWSQVNDGDLLTNGTVSVPIPPGQFLMGNVNNDVGVAFYRTTLNLSGGTLSTRNWRADSAGVAPLPSYTQFRERVPAGVTPTITTSSFLTSSLAVGGSPDSEGFVWYEAPGNAVLNADATIPAGRKIILFVPGDVSISGSIRMANPENSFFMLIAGGNIRIQPSVGLGLPNTNTTPTLEGVYYAGGQFITEVANTRVNVRGTVVSATGAVLNRDTLSESPSETFSFAPEYVLNFPQSLRSTRAFWREVAP